MAASDRIKYLQGRKADLADSWRKERKIMLDTEKIGAFIAEKRRQHGLTQQQLAERSGVARETISRIENGKMQISTAIAKRIAPILNVNYKDLI